MINQNKSSLKAIGQSKKKLSVEIKEGDTDDLPAPKQYRSSVERNSSNRLSKGVTVIKVEETQHTFDNSKPIR
jgi:hypothetical protein